jgi:hypothetical protein
MNLNYFDMVNRDTNRYETNLANIRNFRIIDMAKCGLGKLNISMSHGFVSVLGLAYALRN